MADTSKFGGKVVVITGAGHGIGREYARRFAAEGAKVVIAEVDDHAAMAAEEELRGGGHFALAVPTDVTDEHSLQRMTERVQQVYGRIDILINNAAIYASIPVTKSAFDQISVAEWDRVMAVNVKGVWLSSRAVLPLMKHQGGGKIVNISSGTALHGGGDFAHYVASKSAILGLTKALARELGKFRVNVNCVAPGFTESEETVTPQLLEYRKTKLAGRALQRPQVPADVVGAVMFLASNESDFMTGQTLVVDGGSVMH